MTRRRGYPLASPQSPALRPAASSGHPYQNESICPTCGGPVPLATFGRPPTYCSTPCRREMHRMRRELADLEEQAADAANKAESGHAPGPYFHESRAQFYREKADALRERIPEDRR